MDGTVPPADRVEIWRAEERFVTERDGVTTRHCLSFGDHYDPARVSVGPLVALNDEVLAPGAGYPTHQHRGVDIVTWVLEGTLRHEDSLGHRSTVRNGTVQRLTAGTGVTHSETNGSGTDECGQTLRFLQLWFALGDVEVEPSYETYQFDEEAQWFGYTPIAGSVPPRASTILAASGVEVAVCHLPRDAWGSISGAGRAYSETFSYVASGSLRTRDGRQLGEGDSARCRGIDLAGVAAEDTVLLHVRFSPGATGR